MPAEDPAVADHAALREALLAHHDAEATAWRLVNPAARAAMRLSRFKLGWLVAPWGMLTALVSFPRAMKRAEPEERRLVRLYRQASGHDPDVSRAEVRRIQAQLMHLDERAPHWLSAQATDARQAGRAELEATAAALLAYYLAGRRTDDGLLAEMQAAYATYEERSRAPSAVFSEQGMRAASRYSKAHRAEETAALDRYVTAWRRWVDHADGATEPATADPTPAEPPAEDRAAPRELWIEQLLALLQDDDPADLDGAAERVRDRLARFKLAWLAVPVEIIGAITSLPRVTRAAVRDHERSVGLYQRLSGKDADVAGAELWRIRRQLMYLDRCLREEPGSSPGGSAPADPAARAAATRALLGYFVAGRPGDDALLVETQAAYAALDELDDRDVDAWRAFGWRRWRRRRAHDAAVRPQREAAKRGYCEAWRRWLERQPADRSS